MDKIIISGGPHTGKTILLDKLRKIHPELIYVPEPATLVIESEHKRESREAGYNGTFPWNNYLEFGPKVISKSLELERQLSEESTLAVLDRSLIDTVAYARLNDCSHLLFNLYEHIIKAEYTMVFVCDLVGSYQAGPIRSETFEEAQLTHEAIKLAYGESGISVAHMPSVDVEERVKLFERELNNY